MLLHRRPTKSFGARLAVRIASLRCICWRHALFEGTCSCRKSLPVLRCPWKQVDFLYSVEILDSARQHLDVREKHHWQLANRRLDDRRARQWGKSGPGRGLQVGGTSRILPRTCCRRYISTINDQKHAIHFGFLESSFIDHSMQRRPALARGPPQGP